MSLENIKIILKSSVKGCRGRNFFSHRRRRSRLRLRRMSNYANGQQRCHRRRRSRFSYVEFTRLREMDSRDKVFPLQNFLYLVENNTYNSCAFIMLTSKSSGLILPRRTRTSCPSCTLSPKRWRFARTSTCSRVRLTVAYISFSSEIMP